jgi:predicted nucleic acid-binding protein
MKAVDTNVLIYAIDETDRTRHQQGINLLSELALDAESPLLLWQVACEYLSFLRRQLHARQYSKERVREEMQKVLDTYPLQLPAAEVIEIAQSLFGSYSLSHWDSVLLAACISAGVDTLYSEDMTHGMTYESVTVFNPFRD